MTAIFIYDSMAAEGHLWIFKTSMTIIIRQTGGKSGKWRMCQT